MTRSNLYATLVTVALAGMIGMTPAARADIPGATKTTTTDAALRDLWLGHVFWVRGVVVATIANNKAAADAAEKSVVANAKAIAAAFEPYYGKEASAKRWLRRTRASASLTAMRINHVEKRAVPAN